MAYNNVSYKEAIEILEGSEEDPTEIYDRYEKPSNWPMMEREGRRDKQGTRPTYKDKLLNQNKKKTQ